MSCILMDHTLDIDSKNLNILSIKTPLVSFQCLPTVGFITKMIAVETMFLKAMLEV